MHIKVPRLKKEYYYILVIYRPIYNVYINFINCITWFNSLSIAHRPRIKSLFFFLYFLNFYLPHLLVFTHFYPICLSNIHNFVISGRYFYRNSLKDLRNYKSREI